MADPAQHEQSAQDQVPESPTSPSVAGAYANAAAQSPHSHHHPPSPRLCRKRRPSEARSISVDFFDPEGVRELRREMSHASAVQLGMPVPSEDGESVSDHTLQEGRFDLEKTLRDIMHKYVSFSYSFLFRN